MYKSLEDLHNEFPWKTYSRFRDLAHRYGFKNDVEIKQFFDEQVMHDEKLKKPIFLPIYSKNSNSYQFDTFIQSNRKLKNSKDKTKYYPFLIFINVNTRKAYSYQMKNKGSKEILRCLNIFKNDVKIINSLTSDQDSSYLNKDVLLFMNSNNIDYRTTKDENHNVLGIINRFIRTLRDLNHEQFFTENTMNKLVNEYNNTKHSSIDKTPNEMNENDEIEYIADKNTETLMKKETNSFNIGDHVRIILEKNKIGKNRSNLSNYAYIIDDHDGNNYLIKSKDNSVDSYPAYRLVKCDDRYKIANTIKSGKRGIIDKIIDYDEKNDKYHVLYDEGTKDYILAKNLRESNPSKLSSMEREFWANKSNIPIKIRQWF